MQLDAVLELDIRIYEEDTVQILEDVYAPSKELTPVFGEESYESLLIRNYAKSEFQIESVFQRQSTSAADLPLSRRGQSG